MQDPERLRFLPASQQVLYRVLDRAARAGDMCPPNRVLQEHSGHASVSGPAEALKALERYGFIKVERYQSSRRVTILHTGMQTAEPYHKKTPHWRHR